MSSIPVRRATRAATRVPKDSENAHAKSSRIVTRSKVQSSSTLAENAKTTATTTSAKPKNIEAGTEKSAIKRKREILGEVTEPNSGKSKSASSTKGKEKASNVEPGSSKPKLATKAVRVPLREVGGTTSSQRALRSKAVAGDRQVLRPIKEDKARDEMVVDEPRIRSAVFKVVAKSSVRSNEIASSGEDDLDREPVFKKRITEDEGGRQPVARPTFRQHSTAEESQLEEDRIANELADVREEEEEEPVLWDDLDAEDTEDPLMASEYIHEIMAYMKELEVRLAPTPDYMSYHSALDWEKRNILIEWVLQIHTRFNFLAESFFLFVNIMDRFLSLRPTVALQKLQLVGVSCFVAAVKFEEGMCPSTEDLVLLTGKIYTAEEICKAERYVLKTIDFDLSFPGPMSWLRRGSKADDLDPIARTIAKYLLELACFSPSLIATPSSLLAAASLWLARIVLGREDWTPNLCHYTTYEESELLPVAEVLLTTVLSPVPIEFLHKKYASKKYVKCSVYMRRWATARFRMGTEVDLTAILPAIKEQIVESRLAQLEDEQP